MVEFNCPCYCRILFTYCFISHGIVSIEEVEELAEAPHVWWTDADEEEYEEILAAVEAEEQLQDSIQIPDDYFDAKAEVAW